MKYAKIALLLVGMMTGASFFPQNIFAQQASVSFQLFYDELSPYGMWVDYPDYGYVWIPKSNPGFSPYGTDGYWVFTEDGWTWVSDYPWGWAAFHYGRWDYDNSVGWFWVPDNEWGPAWVSWRRSPGYYGWAPMRPGISISISFGSNYQERNERWTFVRERDIVRRDISRHYVSRTRNRTIINKSTVIVNTRKDSRRNVAYIAGPDRDDVQSVTRTRIDPISVRENDQPGHRLRNDELHIYRPTVEKKNGSGQLPAPSKVTRLNEVRHATERNSEKPQRIVSPSNTRSREQQKRTVAPVNRDRKEQQQKPKPDQGSKEKRKRDQ